MAPIWTALPPAEAPTVGGGSLESHGDLSNQPGRARRRAADGAITQVATSGPAVCERRSVSSGPSAVSVSADGAALGLSWSGLRRLTIAGDRRESGPSEVSLLQPVQLSRCETTSQPIAADLINGMDGPSGFALCAVSNTIRQ